MIGHAYVPAGGGGTAKAVIGVKYPNGSTCICEHESGKIINSKNTDGKSLFFLNQIGKWTVKSDDTVEKKHTEKIIDVELNEAYSILLNYIQELFNNTNGINKDLLGSWALSSIQYTAQVGQQMNGSSTYVNVDDKHIEIELPGIGAVWTTWCSSKLINLSDFDLIKFTIPSYYGTDFVGVYEKGNTKTIDQIKDGSTITITTPSDGKPIENIEVEIDIKDLSGEYYIIFGSYGWASKLKISEITMQ